MDHPFELIMRHRPESERRQENSRCEKQCADGAAADVSDERREDDQGRRQQSARAPVFPYRATGKALETVSRV
jgi:hypothetical protein